MVQHDSRLKLNCQISNSVYHVETAVVMIPVSSVRNVSPTVTTRLTATQRQSGQQQEGSVTVEIVLLSPPTPLVSFIYHLLSLTARKERLSMMTKMTMRMKN